MHQPLLPPPPPLSMMMALMMVIRYQRGGHSECGGRPDDVSGGTAVNQHSENDGEHVDLLDRFAPLPQNPTTDETNAEPSIPAPSTPQTNNGIAGHDDGPNIPKGRWEINRSPDAHHPTRTHEIVEDEPVGRNGSEDCG